MTTEAAAAPAAGERIGPYRVVGLVGEGASAWVLEVTRDDVGRSFALKVLRARALSAPDVRLRIEREARVANRVRHPGVVEVVDVGQLPSGEPYLVMPLLRGESLRQRLSRGGPLPEPEARALVRRLAEVLQAAHEAGVVHRDLKPDNVFLEQPAGEPRGEGEAPRELVRVLDFGLAKLVAPTLEPGAEPPDALRSLAGPGALVGTPAYMAPEQWWGAEVDARADQYSLACIAFELVRGAPPFGAGAVARLLEAHLHERPERLEGPLGPVVERALEKDREARFPSLRELLHELARGADTSAGEPSPGTPTTGPPTVGPPTVGAQNVGAPTIEGRPGDGRAAEGSADVGSEVAPASSQARAPAAASRRASVVVALASLVGLAALGFAGPARFRPLECLRLSGWGGLVATIVGLSGLALVLARPGWAAGALGAASLALGSLGTYSNWRAVAAFLARLPPLERLEVFHHGAYESAAARFLGAGLGGSVLSAAAFAGREGVWPRERATLAASLGLFSLGLLGVLLGQPPVGLLGLAGALGVAALAPRASSGPGLEGSTPRGDERRATSVRALCSLLGVLGLTLAVSARAEAQHALVWGAGRSRAERVEALAWIEAEHAAISVLGLVVVAIVAIFAARALARAGVRLRALATRAPLVGSSIFLALVALDRVEVSGHERERARLFAQVAAQFGPPARLEHPTCRLDPARFAPHRAVALQASRELVAVDGEPMAKLGALVSAPGAQNLARDLGHALARAAAEEADGGVELAVSIHRELTGEEASRVLGVARAAGVTEVELVCFHGVRPPLSAARSLETTIVLPSDFVALRASLVARGAGHGAVALEPREAWSTLVGSLAARALAGEALVLEVP